MSLFGTTLNQQAQPNTTASPSLFGQQNGAQSASSAPSAGLFGRLSTPLSQQTGANNNTTPATNPFGQPQQSQQALGSGGLFSGLGANQSTAQQQPSGAASLFGGLGGTKNQAQQGNNGAASLFGGLNGNSAQAQQQGTGTASLFGGLSGATPQQQGGSKPATSLFGTSTTNQPTTGGGAGLFGGFATAQQQSQPQQPALNNALGNSLLSSNNNNAIANTAPIGAIAQQTSTQGAYFDNLLERGKKRQDPSSGLSRFGDLPSLQLGLGDIASKVRNLGSSENVTRANGAESKAHYLLAASGVSRGTTLQDLNTFAEQADLRPSATATSNQTDINLDTFVAQISAKTTLDLINESMEQSKRDFDAFLEENVQMNWDLQRRRIYEHFGLAKASGDEETSANEAASVTSRGAFGRSSRRGPTQSLRNGSKTLSGGAVMSRSVLGGSVSRNTSQASLFTDVADKTGANGLPSGSEDPYIRDRQEKYAAKVKDLNSSRLQEIVYPVIQHFASVERESSGDTPKHLLDAYDVLKAITRETSQAQRPSDPGAIKERQYAKDYLDDTPTSAKSTAMRKQVLSGSLSFLESSFFQQIEELVAKNPREANVGGVPSKINKVRAYIRLRVARKDLGTENHELQMLGDDYCWALIFYLIRAGLINEATQYVAENERAIKSMDRHFAQYMAAYGRDPDRRLGREMHSRINAEFQQRLRLAPENSIDPYRMACYKVVGRCDLSRKNLEGVNTTMEDWVWLLFSLAREANRVEEAAGEVFGLDDAREMIKEIGQRHFSANADNGSGYATFFFLQILSGMFEQAVAWLYPRDYVAAVHFAIALDFYGLLRVSDISITASELLTYSTRQQPQISFGRLLGYYTRDFRIARPEAATDYLILLCLNADLPSDIGKSHSSVCHEALQELVLETREFALLLGDIRADGKRVKGAIEQRLKLVDVQDRDDFLRILTLQAAAVADDSGRTTDAVLLYHLAEEYDNVITIINRALSDAIAVEVGQQHMRLQPLKPRTSQAVQPAKQTEQDHSLSLTSVDDPAVLARNMMTLYNANALYFRKIRQTNRDSCGVLLRMSEAKSKVEESKWAEALDIIDSLKLLPLHAASNVTIIRSDAQAFNLLPPVIVRNIGNVLIWTITCCGRQRQVLRSSAFQTNKPIADELLTAAKDLMVFAGLIRYKLPPDVFEVLARAGQEVGAY